LVLIPDEPTTSFVARLRQAVVSRSQGHSLNLAQRRNGVTRRHRARLVTINQRPGSVAACREQVGDHVAQRVGIDTTHR
jgi:hypothetical protein